MKEKLEKILNEINPEILRYTGEDLIEDHVIDSFDIIEIASEIADDLGIEIDPELIVWDCFVSVEAIAAFYNKIKEEQC